MSRAELARLELQYLDLFWFDEDGVPNLEREVEARPDLFCEAVALVYRSEEDDDNGLPTEDQRNAAGRRTGYWTSWHACQDTTMTEF